MTGAKSKKKGRPSLYTEALAAEICRRLAEGESLRAICADKAIPGISTVMGWLFDGNHGEFSEQYARAREAQAEIRADEIVDIADDASGGVTWDEISSRCHCMACVLQRGRTRAAPTPRAGQMAPKI